MSDGPGTGDKLGFKGELPLKVRMSIINKNNRSLTNL